MQQKRYEQILGEVVKSYMQTGMPVGSRTLSSQPEISLSSASIRNAMAILERMGLLYSPHTSAGRIPTDLGLRYFIDSLMVIDSAMHMRTEISCRQHVHNDGDLDAMMQQLSHELSDMTQFTGIVSMHEHGFSRIRQVHLLPLSSQQILAVIESDEGVVQNRLLPREKGMNDKKLNSIARTINELLADCTLSEAGKRLQYEMRQTRLQIGSLLESLAIWANQPMEEEVLFVSGQSRLLDIPEINVMDTVRSLMRTFEEKKNLLSVIHQVEDNDNGVKVFIGSEHSLADMQQISMVLSRFECNGRVLGTLGVIGPRSMDYERVLPVVDCTARWISKMVDGVNDTHE
ncbi:MAG: heat-inducible transcriptional repressor HrcA [Mariprofundales bacterium]